MESPEVQDRSLSEPRDPECAVATVLNQESPSISQSPRLESISPMEDEAEAESRSLELPSLCQTGEGKKNVQSVIEGEKKIKFSNPDDDLSPSFECSPRAGRKLKSKSSTLSLHSLAKEEEDDSPQLQRRNSIHNVPFVDVNDPETRTRMERYKEERRSMLRAKYKAEDYLSNSYSRKKKVSTTSSQDSTETPPSPSPSVTREETKEIHQKVETPPPSPPILRAETSLPQPVAISSATISVSRKLVDLRQPEHTTFISRKSLPDNFNSTNTFVEKQQTPKKWSMGSRTEFIPTNSPQKLTRPSELTFSVSAPFQSRSVLLDQGELMNRKNQVFKVNSAEIANMTDNKINTDEIEDNVNVRERATIFGPRKVTESKMRTVSVSASMASVTPVSKARKFSEGHANNPTSPSKIRNMAAMFEQKH